MGLAQLEDQISLAGVARRSGPELGQDVLAATNEARDLAQRISAQHGGILPRPSPGNPFRG